MLKTPPLVSILEGITRDAVITLARDKGIEVVEQSITRDELYCADEVFLTGTAAEITPVREVDDRTDRRGRARPDHEDDPERVLRGREGPRPQVRVLAHAGLVALADRVAEDLVHHAVTLRVRE